MTLPTRSAAARAAPRRPLVQAQLDRSGQLFEAGVLQLLLIRQPDNLEYLAALGQVWAELGDHRRGLAIDERLVALRPEDATCHYNLACSFSQLGRLDESCAALLRALELGFRDAAHLMTDADLVALREDARFGLIRDRLAGLGEVS